MKARLVFLYFLFFLLLVERRVGNFTKSFFVDHKLHRWQQHRMYKGSSSGMGVAASIYRLSPAHMNLFLLTISASSDLTRFFLGIPRILAMKYACCAAKAKVMWLTWMLVMLCRLLLLLLLLGLRLSLHLLLG